MIFFLLPAVVLVLCRDFAVRKLGPEVSLALATRLGIAVLPLPNPSVFFLQQHGERGVWRTKEVDLSMSSVVVVHTIWTAVHPRLRDVD